VDQKLFANKVTNFILQTVLFFLCCLRVFQSGLAIDGLAGWDGLACFHGGSRLSGVLVGSKIVLGMEM
jgi:hypothetical protein